VAFYQKALGFKEAYALKKPEGSPLLTYLQIGRDTFLEVSAVHAHDGPRRRAD
jgi:hypothetical protein